MHAYWLKTTEIDTTQSLSGNYLHAACCLTVGRLSNNNYTV